MRRRAAMAVLTVRAATFATLIPVYDTVWCREMAVAQRQSKKEEILGEIDSKDILLLRASVFSYIKSSASEKDKMEVMKKYVEKGGEEALDRIIPHVILNFGFNTFQEYVEATKDKDRSSYLRALAYGIAYFGDKGFDTILEKAVQIGKGLNTERFSIAHGIFTEAVHMMANDRRIDVKKAAEKVSQRLLAEELDNASRQLLLQWLGKLQPAAVCDVRDRLPVGELRTMAADHVDYLIRKLGAVPCKTR